MYFSSKRDFLLSVILWICALSLIILPIFFPDSGVWMTPDFLNKQWIKIVILIPIGLGILWIWFKTGYVIEHDVLKIKYGPVKKKIRIEDIYSIREAKNPFSALALSMDKLEINCRNYKTISISPKNKKEFIDILLTVNPNIIIETY